MNKKISLQAQKENSILIWNDRVGKRERQSLGHEVKSMYNPEQEELLREYNQQFPTSFEYIDETTGEKKYRKYMLPDDAPELDEPELNYILSFNALMSGTLIFISRCGYAILI